MTTLTQQSIYEAVINGFFNEVYFFENTGSTNDVAHQLAAQGAPDGTLVITEYQSAGRGRKARTWDAAPGVNLLMSLLLRPKNLAPSASYQLVMAAGLTISEAVRQVTGLRVEVKWPNDLQLAGKKFCGLLPESSMQGEQVDYAIIGMGINVNQCSWQDDSIAQLATSLAEQAGQRVDRLTLLQALSESFSAHYAQINTPYLFDQWRQVCSTLGKRVIITQPGGKQLHGLATNIDAVGTLTLKGKHGAIAVSFGDASLRYDE